MSVQSGFMRKSFTSLTGPRCSQREKPIEPSLIRKGSAEWERFWEQTWREASPSSIEMVASWVTWRPWLYSSARRPICV